MRLPTPRPAINSPEKLAAVGRRQSPGESWLAQKEGDQGDLPNPMAQ
jgi:hypothetical protein